MSRVRVPRSAPPLILNLSFHVSRNMEKQRRGSQQDGDRDRFREQAIASHYPRQHRPPNPTHLPGSLHINPSTISQHHTSHPSPGLSRLKSRPHSNKPPPEPLRRSPSPTPQPSCRPAFTRVPHPAPEKAHPAPEPGMHPLYNPVPHQTRPNSAAAEPFENLCPCGYSGRPDRRNRPLPHSPLSAWLNLLKRRMFR